MNGFISHDHFILLSPIKTFTFHLKDHYWSQMNITNTKDRNFSPDIKDYQNLRLVKPGLAVSLRSHSTGSKEEPNFLSLETITFDTDKGNFLFQRTDGIWIIIVPRNFCRRFQKFQPCILEGASGFSFDADEISGYAFGGRVLARPSNWLFQVNFGKILQELRC